MIIIYFLYFCPGNTELSFELSATNDQSGEAALQSMESLFNGSSNSLNYQGFPLRLADPSCGFEVDDICRVDSSNSMVRRFLF